ncbi:mitochondrial ribosomal subunit protein-domain-containing protein [Fomitopsis serialis]|uniref:mitochondrial ribosomal subunit protein-domain-containing protein n=1 Tax=Fomitopsis serialis TaxID=139415 RepID=UPI00200892D7|nr:mitochondrial ribosomal subunit protein-domain-containing protein [Neoantrodia serialis]KAH9937198.1 mitochondrial ribosomal subunit protein-domain-containing protein [Neoantrodia serialis]
MDQFHTSAAVALRRQPDVKNAGARLPGLEALDDSLLEENEQYDALDTGSAGHLRLQQQRRVLYYWRLIEHEMPNLVAYRKPFVPPSSSAPLVVRSIAYGGEEHPASLKRTIVVPVARLPLKDEAAIHKFKLLTGSRWTPEPPVNSGISPLEESPEHGYFSVSCEDFPMPAQNLKWASDALDRLLTEANNTKDSFVDVPLDTRHIEAKKRKEAKGDHVYGRRNVRPSIRDFPKEWLPTVDQSTTPSPPTFQ